jgi:hypothetical protein
MCETPAGAASVLTVELGGDELPWRCFHCHEVFTDPAEAALHFGTSIAQKPACQLNMKWLRYVERQLDRYREEDSDLHRQIHAMASRHQTELRREEEKGYARGLRDGMAMTPEQKSALTTPNAAVTGLAPEKGTMK